MMLGVMAWWGGKAHILEVNLSAPGWPDGYPHSGVVLVDHDWWGDGTAEYVVFDGPWWGLSVPADGASHEVVIPWSFLLRYAAAEGWFSPLEGPAATQGVYNGVEVMGEAVADLYTTKFRTASE
jgi:hypothetical protein